MGLKRNIFLGNWILGWNSWELGWDNEVSMFFFPIVPTVSGLQRFTSEGSSPFSREDTTRPSECKSLGKAGKMWEKLNLAFLGGMGMGMPRLCFPSNSYGFIWGKSRGVVGVELFPWECLGILFLAIPRDFWESWGLIPYNPWES